MEKEDIHYPAKEEVADDEVYQKFLKLQIPGEPIDLVSDDEDKGDDDDDHQNPKDSSQDDANPRDHTKPTTPKSPPKDGTDKGKEITEGTGRSSPPTTSPPKVMEAAMKTKVNSSFVANPLIGLPNEAATSTRTTAGKETDPFIEIYPTSELPTLPTHTILQHAALLQKALTTALSMIELLRLTNTDLNEEHDRMTNRVKEKEADLVRVADELLQAQEKPNTRAKRATKGATSKQSQAEQDAAMWKKSYQTLSEKTKGDKALQDLDKCNDKVQELQDQLKQEQQINAELQAKLKHLQSKHKQQKSPREDEATHIEEVVPQADTTPQPQDATQHNTRFYIQSFKGSD